MNRIDHKVCAIAGNQLDVGWMVSDNESVIQAAESGDPDWMEKAASQLPFGRLIDPEETARAVNFLVSDDAGSVSDTKATANGSKASGRRWAGKT